ncbi:hypothetical protein E2F48_11900 [Arthrobacter crusticola]|uniref:Nuclear transport factor 2 family protein n=1 Tax=Arthrobacter crusticola TaxID=2547960 RepID=A0A4R5TU25_9MICC|nr:hypothetical protein [Arthrobacter crusticola]TDK24534.1 hypothetical protein E2F48_11900 [Arthrobacter crusticola]
MIALTEPAGCGNAPRQLVIRDLVLALAEVDGPRLRELLDEEVRWDLAGAGMIEGISQLTGRLSGQGDVAAIELASILTHGREGSADGVLAFRNGRRQAFCHVLRFASTVKTAKVTEMRSYLVDLPG